MEEKAELSTDHPSEILEPVITSIEGEIDTENTAVDTNIENIEEAGICDEVGIDEDARIDEDVSGENVKTEDDADCGEHILTSEGVGTGEDVGTSENVGVSESIGQNIESGDDKIDEDITGEDVEASNDTNTLISELNDVSLAVVASTETDSLLESLTSENTPADTEPPISDDQTAANATDSTDISTDISMPSLALSNETTPTPPEDMILEDKQEGMIIEQTQNSKDEDIKEAAHILQTEQKDPVCSLEEELQRMHEEDPVSLQSESNTGNKQDSMEKEKKSQIDSMHIEKNQKPIMKDSDLEEMLSADEVLQDPLIIKASQENLRHTDILVCGNCYEVFYFVEEFKDHKLNVCSPASNVLANCIQESKAQVWAFTLWKNKQMKSQTEKNSTRSQWELYKNWCALNENDKNAWISAGQTLQYCQKIGTSKLTEIKVHKVQKDDDKDPLSLDGFDSNKENSSIDSSKSPLLEVKRTVINKPKAVPTVQKIQNDVDTNRAMRSVQSKDKSEYAVERIVAKRFNPKKKTWEYQIKWEHFSSEDNTWEPLSNLNHCKQMVDEFEEQLKKLKAEKAKQQALALAAKNSPKPKPEVKTATSAASSPATSTSFLNAGNRPQRTSKQKALDQVKAWCGNISDDENPTGLKRSRSPDSDESFEKRLKYEDSDDSETETKPKIQFRKIAPKPSAVTTTPIQVIKNGIGKNSPLPQNILIPDANGVVRINQKQLPSLSTGVYIMSKTAGIIKLDSNTSKVATSGGQTIVKVAPKIGQTQIKIMKKDGTSTQQIVQMSPKNIQQPTKAIKQHLARAKKLVTEVKPSHQVIKKTPDMVKRSAILPKTDSDKKQMVIKKIPELVQKQTAKVLTTKSKDNEKEDESDDGLEELPFPDEIKIPEPEEEENSEFTLDPTTGKIAGVEYPDPEPEPIEEAKSDSSLDNIVKLAAADITEEDLKNEPQDSIDIEMHDVMEEDDDIKMIKTETHSLTEKRFTTTSVSRPIVKMSVTPRKVTANPTSILNKALTGPQVVRRTIIGSSNRVPQQRVINQTVARSTQMTSPVVRQVNTYVRTKPLAPRPRFNIASEVPKFIRPNHNTSPKNVYSYSRPVVQNSPATRKIGNTSINRNSSMPMVNNQPKTQTKIIRTSSGIVQRIVSPVKKEPMLVRGQPERMERKVIPQKPKTVISMPSLISDDELLLTTKSTPQKQKSMASPIHTLTVPEDHEQEEMEEEPTVAVVSEPSIAQHSMIQQEPEENIAAVADTSAVNSVAPDMSSFTLADSENPIFITGDDGTVYQVAGQNEQGQTILLTQGSDGQQQCLLVTNEVAEAMETSATEEAPSQPEISMPEISPDVTEPLSVKTDPTENNDQVVAQVVRAEPPSPGGTHKVVVMLPDGNLMVTQVSPEEYASLELE